MFRVLSSFSLRAVCRPGSFHKSSSGNIRCLGSVDRVPLTVLRRPDRRLHPAVSLAVRPCHGTPSSELTPREKLKIAAKEYGAVLVVFHVGISLVSLGTMYLFVSSGVDVQQWIGWLGVSNADENTKIVAGASQFIIAYAIHKSFAPVRISITLVSVPLIVRYLRAKGIMKTKKQKPLP